MIIKALLIFFAISVMCRADFIEDEPAELVFKSCLLPQWKCVNESNDLSSFVSKVSYSCPLSTYTETRYEYDYNYGSNRQKTYTVSSPAQNITLDLSNWTKWTLTALTVENCGTVFLKMHTNFESNVEKLILSNVQTLYIQPPKTTEHNHHPRRIFFKKIRLIPELPANAIADNQTEQVVFHDVVIESTNQEAINLQGEIKIFKLKNVTFGTMEGKAISVTSQDKHSKVLIVSSKFSALESNSISLESGFGMIRNSHLSRIQEASFIIKAGTFILIENYINAFNNALVVESSRIVIKENEFPNKKHAANVVAWTGHKFGASQHHMAFSFVDNFIKPKGNESLSCISKSSAFVNTGNCTTRTSVLEHFTAKDKSKKAMLFNLLVCGNRFDFEVPSEWSPKLENEICS